MKILCATDPIRKTPALSRPFFVCLVCCVGPVLLISPRIRADEIRVDVVVDLTDAGKKIARPTPARPVYYLPLTVGYREEGAFVSGQKLPPATAEVQHLLAEALAQQGYFVMARASAPSIVLVFWWGYLAPEMINTEIAPPRDATNVINSPV